MSGNRTLWIVLLVVALLACTCCCSALLLVSVLTPSRVESLVPEISGLPRFGIDLSQGDRTEQLERVFSVGDAPRLRIQNFAGNVTIRSGAGNAVRVVATKRARSASDLAAIQVDMSGDERLVEVNTSHASRVSSTNLSVRLEVTVPADTEVVLRTGAGTVDINGVSGELTVEAGAGTVSVRGAAGPVDLQTGAGTVEYQGRPAGDCHFHTGVGTITLTVPDDANLTVDLSTGLGTVNSELSVRGTVSARKVSGTTGNGRDAQVTAATGAGTVTLRGQ